MSFFVDLAQIVLIDISLASENAIAVGLAVAALPKEERKRATFIGIAAATGLRIVLALFAVQLLRVTGLLAAGGLLLLWVTWKMVREISDLTPKENDPTAKRPKKKFSEAILQIVIADVSMSLDNVLGVAGVARDHIPALVFGLILSIALMGVGATQIAKLTTRYPKISYVGAAVVLYTALTMIYDGVQETWPTVHAVLLPLLQNVHV
ncbi:MAG: TerC family protein [Alphaproteobacteria bacterium]|nr:TerC family protein [Alphaproteobacteria bacterium]